MQTDFFVQREEVPLKPWPMQETAVNNIRGKFAKGFRKIILMSPTGSGKTEMGMMMAKAALAKGLRVMFIVDRLTLIDQTARRFAQHGFDFGVIQANHHMTDPSKRMQICSVQTLNHRDYEVADLVLVDEAHTVYKVQKKMIEEADKGKFFVGLTATPWTRGLGLIYEDLVITATTKQLIEEGYLADYECWTTPQRPDVDGVKMTGGDYNQKAAAERTNKKKLVADVVETWLKRGQNRKTIVFATDVAHANMLTAAFQRAGVAAETINCYIEDGVKEDVLRRFEDGDTKVLVSVDMVTKGFDQKDVGCIVIARITASLIWHIQAIGRGLRMCEGKKNCIIIDHAGNCERLGYPDDEDFPTTLCTKEKGTREYVRKTPLPKYCPKCHFMKPIKTHKCPNCGFEPERRSNMENEDGELVQRKGKAKQYDRLYKQMFFESLVSMAMAKGYQRGWVGNKYRAKFDCWPRGFDWTPIEGPLLKDAENFVKAQNIAYWNAKKKADEAKKEAVVDAVNSLPKGVELTPQLKKVMEMFDGEFVRQYTEKG